MSAPLAPADFTTVTGTEVLRMMPEASPAPKHALILDHRFTPITMPSQFKVVAALATACAGLPTPIIAV